MNMPKELGKIGAFGIRSILAVRNQMLRMIRGVLLRLQVSINRGHLTLDASVRVNHPIRFQGLGSLEVGNAVQLGYELGGSISLPILLQPRNPDSRIRIGPKTIINNGTELIACREILIGRSCLIGSQVAIYDSDFHGIAPDRRMEQGITLPVTIEDNVWIGSRSTILKGVKIGKDAVIGAGCIVTKSIPAGSIVAGNPMLILGSVYDRTHQGFS